MFVLFRWERLRRLGGGEQNGEMKLRYLIIPHSQSAAKST
jgi:hypothetical protein